MTRADLTTRWMIGLPLVLLPVLLGGARPWFWSWLAAFVLLGAAVFLLRDRLDFSAVENLPWRWFVGCWLVILYPIAQALPLPVSWLVSLDPQRLEWVRRAAEVGYAAHVCTSISYTPVETVFGTLWWVFLVGFTLSFRHILSGTAAFSENGSYLPAEHLKDSYPSWLFKILFAIAAIEAFYGLLQALIPSLGVLWASKGGGIARGTFVNRNHFAAFLGMLWPLLLAHLLNIRTPSQPGEELSFREKQKQKKLRQKQWFFTFMVGLMVLTIFFSQSRGGIIGSVVSLTVFAIFGRTTRKKGLMLFAASCWLIMIVYGSIIGFDEILARFDQMEKDAPGRFKIWGDTWRLIGDHWLTGTGLGSYSEVIRIYQSHLPDKLDIVHAHNDYLELMAELGIPMGAGVILLTWGYWWRCAWRIKSRNPRTEAPSVNGQSNGLVGGASAALETEEGEAAASAVSTSRDEYHMLAVGALAGTAAFLIHSWAEFNWQIPANQIYFIVLMVIMGKCSRFNVQG